MSVSARTFQLLYIVRQRALKDLPTTVHDFSAFISERRAEAPLAYDRAYIAPSAIQDILDRMCSPMENLLVHNNGQFEFEFMGSQMADLLDDIDACSSAFIDGYKEQVVKAVLEQRARLNQPRANQRDIAACANISLDSARRGLQTLMDAGLVIEYATGRTQTYELAKPPAVVVQAPVQPTSIRDALAGISDDPAKPVIIPEALRSLNEEDLLPGQPDDAPVPLGTVLQDGGPDVDIPMAKDDSDEASPVAEGQEDLHDLEDEIPPQTSRRYDWQRVPDFIQADLIVQAKACDMSLADYLNYLVQTASLRFRKSLSTADESRFKALVDQMVFPRPVRKCSGGCQHQAADDSKG